MNVNELVLKNKNKTSLSYNELAILFDGYLSNKVSDSNMTLFLKSVCENGLSDREIFDLTDIFIKSGDVLDLSMISGIKVDKHSTGGVGDKTTLIVGPIVSSCGVKVPKMSGRALGHTGGTIDKLESISGFNVNLSEEEFIKQVNDIGFAVCSQTANLAPMDKKIYALRDVTNTVSSNALIAVSIMSKKIAGGADKILIDLKVGKGALIKDMDSANDLSRIMIAIGEKYNKEVRTLITNMDNPLGNNIGNSLEVLEAIDVLNGKEGHLTDLCVELASNMVSMGKNISLKDAKAEVLVSLRNKIAYNKFLEFVKRQHGDISSLKVNPNRKEVLSLEFGKVRGINALNIGILSNNLGAGRKKLGDSIDYTSGIILNKTVGDFVKYGDLLFTMYSNNDINININDYFDIK